MNSLVKNPYLPILKLAAMPLVQKRKKQRFLLTRVTYIVRKKQNGFSEPH